MKIDVI